MEVKAYLRNLRIAPRKTRLVVDAVRGLDVTAALNQLAFIEKRSARPITKLLRSAMANAEHNFKLEPAALYVKTITADGGPVLKRSRARAFGRAAPIRKRMTHVTLVLEEITNRPPKKSGRRSAKSTAETTATKQADQKPVAKAKPVKKPVAKATAAKPAKKSSKE